MTAKIIPTPRQVIGDQLLTALDDKAKVALIFNEADLDLLLKALRLLSETHSLYSLTSMVPDIITDIQLLKDSAFPSGEKQ